MLRLIGEMGVTNDGQNGLMPEDLLDLDQINAGFNQMWGIAVAQTVGRDLFLGRKRVAASSNSWSNWCD